jgi:hypothetical protein
MSRFIFVMLNAIALNVIMPGAKAPTGILRYGMYYGCKKFYNKGPW